MMPLPVSLVSSQEEVNFTMPVPQVSLVSHCIRREPIVQYETSLETDKEESLFRVWSQCATTSRRENP